MLLKKRKNYSGKNTEHKFRCTCMHTFTMCSFATATTTTTIHIHTQTSDRERKRETYTHILCNETSTLASSSDLSSEANAIDVSSNYL